MLLNITNIKRIACAYNFVLLACYSYAIGHAKAFHLHRNASLEAVEFVDFRSFLVFIFIITC
jgi:hypothetical protein